MPVYNASWYIYLYLILRVSVRVLIVKFKASCERDSLPSSPLWLTIYVSVFPWNLSHAQEYLGCVPMTATQQWAFVVCTVLRVIIKVYYIKTGKNNIFMSW